MALAERGDKNNAIVTEASDHWMHPIWIAGIEARDFGFEISPAEVRDLKQ